MIPNRSTHAAASEPVSPVSPPSRVVGRRLVLRSLGFAVASLPAAKLLGCGGADSSAVPTAGADASAANAAAEAGIVSSNVPWATGGTAAMTGKAAYPNPFASPVVNGQCAMSCSLQEGPCYSSQSEELQDISYGALGMPTRVYFRVLDEECKPVVGALVDVWHVTPSGKYTGNDTVNESVAYCTDNDPAYTSKLTFRGKQRTDAQGVVYFDTCFPGWYSSRAVHIHLTISLDDKAYLTTQFGFDDTLNDAILQTQALYDDRGVRDTRNDDDFVFDPSTYQKYLFQSAQMPDGALLAWKEVVLRTSLTTTLCAADRPGSGGFPEGGFPEGGFPEGGFPDGGFPFLPRRP